MDTTSRALHAATSATLPDRVRLAWPPPGLEAMHDALGPIVRLAMIGSALFAGPLLLVLGDETPYWSLGPFGTSWWIPVVTSVIALVLLLAASLRLAQLLRAAAAGARLGYSAKLMGMVAADGRRDSGFVLQGVRDYATMAADERALLLGVRTLAPVCYLVAALWVPPALALSALLGYAQLLGPRDMFVITLSLPGFVLVAAVLANALEATLFVRAKRAASQASVAQETSEEAAAWSANLQLLTGDDAPRAPSPRLLRWSGVAVVVPTLLLTLPLTGLIGLLALGPLVAKIAAPNLGTMQGRQAAAAVLRPYRLPADASVSAADAGHALHNLSSIGGRELPPLMAPFTRAHAEPWFPPGEEPLGRSVSWAGDLFERVRAGLDPDQRAFLARVAAHPAHREFEILARASVADIAGTRYILPLPDTLNPFALPIPRFSGVREGAYAHIAKAGYELAQGNAVRAERTIREVLSAGLLLADEGPTLIDAVIGLAIADIGGHGLENFYRATGRTAEAERLHVARTAATQAADVARRRSGPPSLDHWLQQMPKAVADTALLRGMRWEQYVTFNTLSPCINLHQAVFGRDEHFRSWLEQAEQALVRHPGERALFAIGRNGWLGGVDDRCGLSVSRLRLAF